MGAFLNIRILAGFVLGSLFFYACSSDEKSNQENGDVQVAGDSLQIQRLHELIESDSGNPEHYHKRARIYIREKKLANALSDVENAISLDSLNPEYYMTLADVRYAGGRIYEALEALARVRELDPSNIEAGIRVAEIHLILREYQNSVEVLNEVITLDGSNTTAHFMRGMNFKEVGDTARALQDFQRTIDIDRNYYDAYMQLGILMHAQNNAAAEGYFSNALELKPESEEALYGRGLWYQDHGELNKALQDYTSIVTLNPGNANAHFNLGYIHQVELKIYQQAVIHYSDALRANAQYAQAYYNRGLCYETLGDVQAAFADYQAALTIQPGYQAAEEGLERVSQ